MSESWRVVLAAVLVFGCGREGGRASEPLPPGVPGGAWTRKSPPTHPDLRHTPLVYDTTRKVTLLFGGTTALQGKIKRMYDDTWTWDGTAWTQVTPEVHPLNRAKHVLVFDSRRGVAVLFGGLQGGDKSPRQPMNDTWEWDGVRWTQRNTPSSPPPLVWATTAYDSGRGVTVLFGGCATSEDTCPGSDRTWEYDGTNWVEKSVSPKPPARAYAAMAYDAARAVTVLFGGAAMQDFLNDTWEWNGSQWAQRTSSVKPPRLAGCALFYDASRRLTTLFGGHDASYGFHNETWEWNGSDWTRRAPPPPLPEPRSLIGMAYDPARSVGVLFGGGYPIEGGKGFTDYDDTWEWTGPPP